MSFPTNVEISGEKSAHEIINGQLVRLVRRQTEGTLPELSATVKAVTVSIELRFVEPYLINSARRSALVSCRVMPRSHASAEIRDGIWRY